MNLAARAIESGELTLSAARGVWRQCDRTLFVADLHLGKAAALRAAGAPAPTGASEATLARLAALVAATRAERLVVLGDFVHARASLTPGLIRSLADWRRAHSTLDCLIVRGNHDIRAGLTPEACGFACLDEPAPFGDIHGRHHPLDDAAALAPGPLTLAGHWHPAARLHGLAHDSLKLPCFAVLGRQIVLPAFGEFTGFVRWSPPEGGRVFVVVEDRVIESPTRRTPSAARGRGPHRPPSPARGRGPG